MPRQTRVARSLLDRVFGGVCGGLGAYLGINPWWVRGAWLVLVLLSSGTAALLYLLLWWILPLYDAPDAPPPGRDIGMLLVVGALFALTGAITAARGMDLLSGPTGGDLFVPGLVLLAGLALLWRELRA